jgi:serine/threonine protein kinase
VIGWSSVVDVVAVDDAPQRVTFGGYTLLERLAMGGMAEVFLARPEGQDRLVAVKRILPSVAADDEFVAMFIDEAKIAGQLTHPNIAQILDIGKINNSYFIAMEYVSGQDLRGLWDRTREAAPSMPRGMPIPIACHLVKKLSEALDHAHRKRDAKGRPLGIIHRDVSPQNVLVSYDGELKIIDFGIAKAANRIVKTQTGVLKGKFAYMAPEQARGDPIDHRSDVFAIGVILYELLTGERAFRGDTDFVLLEKVRRVDVVAVRELRSDLPRELERIVNKALSREAGDRYAWASALAGDLDRFMSDQGITTSRDELGAFVRRLFRHEHAEEVARLSQMMKSATGVPAIVKGDGTARNEGPVRPRAAGQGVETTSVQPAEPPTVQPALAAAAHNEETATVNPFAEPRNTGSAHKRRRAPTPSPVGIGPPAVTPLPASLSSPQAPLSIVPEEKREAIITGSQKRLRATSSMLPPPLPPPSQIPPPLPTDDNDTVAPAGLGDVDVRGPAPGTPATHHRVERGAPVEERRPPGTAPPRIDSAIVVAACVLGGLVGAALGVGGALAVRPAGPDTLVVVEPRQSEVRLGERVLCAQTPCAIALGRGRHELSITAPGAEPVTRSVEVGDGAAVLDVSMPPAIRSVRVETDPPGASVVLDEVPLPAVTPLSLPPAAIGATVRLRLIRDGYDAVVVERVVDEASLWRFALPTPTTTWTLTTKPTDALIAVGRTEGTGRLVLNAGRRPLTVDITRPGCAPTRIPLAGTGRKEATHEVTLACDPLTSRLRIASSKRPSVVKLNGLVVARGADLSDLAVPPGSWTVTVAPRGGREHSVTVETVADAVTEARFR